MERGLRDGSPSIRILVSVEHLLCTSFHFSFTTALGDKNYLCFSHKERETQRNRELESWPITSLGNSCWIQSQESLPPEPPFTLAQGVEFRGRWLGAVVQTSHPGTGLLRSVPGSTAHDLVMQASPLTSLLQCRHLWSGDDSTSVGHCEESVISQGLCKCGLL